MDAQAECESFFIGAAIFAQSEFVTATNRRHFSVPVFHTDIQPLAIVIRMVPIDCKGEEIVASVDDIVGDTEPEIRGQRKFVRF